MDTSQQRLGPYELQQQMRSEPRIEVWKAFDTRQPRYVSLYSMRVDPVQAPAFFPRFLHEAELLKTLHHPHIIPVLDFHTVANAPENRAYLVTEYNDGISLADYIQTIKQKGHHPSPQEIIRLMLTLSAALDYAHQGGVLHGSLKPANILLNKHSVTLDTIGTPLLTGFCTHDLYSKSTLPLEDSYYSAPEIARGQPISAQTDVYALAAILYTLFTGTPPFQGTTSAEVIQQQMQTALDTRRLSSQALPATAVTVISRGLAKESYARFPSASALIYSLAQALQVPLSQISGELPSHPGLTSNTTMRSNLPAGNPMLTPVEPLLYGTVPPTVPYTTLQPSSPSLPRVATVGTDLNLAHQQMINTPTEGLVGDRFYYSQPGLAAVSAPPLPVAPPPTTRPRRSTKPLYAAIGILLVLALIGGLVLTSVIRNLPTSTAPSLGQAIFSGSGQLDKFSDAGIADELYLNLANLPAPQPGNRYYAWLRPDDRSETPLLLGSLTLKNGKAQLPYQGDRKHTNILSRYSRILITEEDANVTPVHYSLDEKTWRFGAAFSKATNPDNKESPYSFLDHLRHLLALDPTLDKLGLPGGLDIWLFRNTQKLLEFAGNARDSNDTALIQRQLARMIGYLNGQKYIRNDVPAGTPVLVDKTITQVGLLQIDPQQKPPAYIRHISVHLDEISHIPGATEEQRTIAARINRSISNVQDWLVRVHDLAVKLLKMGHDQPSSLLSPNARTMLNDLFILSSYAFVGQTDPNTNLVKEGVAQIHYDIQRLATMEFVSCSTTKTACV